MASEKRLIDANAFKSFLCKCCNILRSEEPCEPNDCSVWAVIDEQPTVDAVEVVHGRWKEVTDQDEIVGEMDFYQCSVCGKLRWFETNYCPNCGAKMDGDGNG